MQYLIGVDIGTQKHPCGSYGGIGKDSYSGL